MKSHLQDNKPSKEWSVTNLMHGKVVEYTIGNLPIGIISDIHGNSLPAITAINKHPEITQWFCLGDIVDYSDRFGSNEPTVEWIKNFLLPCIIGNHDKEAVKDSKVNHKHREYIRSLPESFKLTLPNGKHLLCYHSLPGDLNTFVDPHFTEREFMDSYPIEDDTVAILIGHNHRQFKNVYPYYNPELWSVGSIGVNDQYAIVDSNGINFHTL